MVRAKFRLSFFGAGPLRPPLTVPTMQKLPPIRLSGYPAIIFSGTISNSHEKRETWCEKKKVSDQNFPAIRVPEHNPSLSFENRSFDQLRKGQRSPTFVESPTSKISSISKSNHIEWKWALSITCEKVLWKSHFRRIAHINDLVSIFRNATSISDVKQYYLCGCIKSWTKITPPFPISQFIKPPIPSDVSRVNPSTGQTWNSHFPTSSSQLWQLPKPQPRPTTAGAFEPKMVSSHSSLAALPLIQLFGRRIAVTLWI